MRSMRDKRDGTLQPCRGLWRIVTFRFTMSNSLDLHAVRRICRPRTPPASLHIKTPHEAPLMSEAGGNMDQARYEFK